MPSVILGVIALAKPVTTGKPAKVSGNRGGWEAAAVQRVAQKQAGIGFDRQSLPETPCLPANSHFTRQTTVPPASASVSNAVITVLLN